MIWTMQIWLTLAPKRPTGSRDELVATRRASSTSVPVVTGGRRRLHPPPDSPIDTTVRILVTGGAGFIGSHLVGALVDRGDEVVVIDSLEPQVHGDRMPSLPEGVEFIRGSVGDRQCADAALKGVEAVVHLAAAVGVGQSMYEIERYVHGNTLATASFLERVVAERTGPRATRRRLLDVDLRRG